MIEILTVFVGLMTGPQMVHLEVQPAVARVEIRVDEELLGTLTEPPWAFRLNLGTGLRIAELEVTALDTEGQEVASDRSWINYEPPATEGHAATPVLLRLTAPGSELPARHEMQGWFRAGGETARLVADPRGGETEGAAEVAVVIDPLARPWLERLVELYPEQYVKQSGGEWPELERLEPEMRRALVGETSFLVDVRRLQAAEPSARETVFSALPDFWRAFLTFAALPPGARVRWVSPRAAGDSSTAVERSVSTQVRGVEGLGLLRLARTARERDFPLRFADAVATTGLELSATGRPRAVVLLRAGSPDGGSRLQVPVVRSFLDALGVPLVVWDLLPDQPSDGWGQVQMVGHTLPPDGETVTFERAECSYEALGEAVRELAEKIESQRVVWVDRMAGPGDIELAPGVEGVQILTQAQAAKTEREEAP